MEHGFNPLLPLSWKGYCLYYISLVKRICAMNWFVPHNVTRNHFHGPHANDLFSIFFRGIILSYSHHCKPNGSAWDVTVLSQCVIKVKLSVCSIWPSLRTTPHTPIRTFLYQARKYLNGGHHLLSHFLCIFVLRSYFIFTIFQFQTNRLILCVWGVCVYWVRSIWLLFSSREWAIF